MRSVDDFIEQYLDSQAGADVNEEAQEENADPILSQGSTADEMRRELEQELNKGCWCKDRCFCGLDTKEVYKRILGLRELSKNEKEVYLMGKLDCLNIGKVTRYGEGSESNTHSYCWQISVPGNLSGNSWRWPKAAEKGKDGGL